MPEVMLLRDVTVINLPGTTLLERNRFAHAFHIETNISPELIVFYGLNDQIEVQGMTDAMRSPNPNNEVQCRIEHYAEQV